MISCPYRSAGQQELGSPPRKPASLASEGNGHLVSFSTDAFLRSSSGLTLLSPALASHIPDEDKSVNLDINVRGPRLTALEIAALCSFPQKIHQGSFDPGEKGLPPSILWHVTKGSAVNALGALTVYLVLH